MEIMREIDHQLVGIAWSLWRELGVAGTERFHENCLVQPEELIILTSIISKYDPRLRDEALDWCSRYHEYISVSRLRTFLKELDADVMHNFSQFAAALNSVSIAKCLNVKEPPQYKVKVSGKSTLPPLESPSLLMLRLRSLFGPGAKADILAYLLTNHGLHFSASDLGEIGYSKRSLMTALDHLAESRVLTVTNIRNKKSYELTKPKELQVIVGNLPKQAPPWYKILRVVLEIRNAIPEIQNSSETTQGILLRNCLIKLQPLLPAIISPLLATRPNFENDWKACMNMLKAFSQGNFFIQFEVYNEFEKIVSLLILDLYQLDDCVDGINMILDCSKRNTNRHKGIYKEGYQLFLSFIKDLEESLKKFLDYPFHQMFDEPLADISYRYKRERLPELIKMLSKIKTIDQITTEQMANWQYQQVFVTEFNVLQQFILSFRKRLADLYFVKTDIHLLTLSPTLYKRHLVLDLFSVTEEN